MELVIVIEIRHKMKRRLLLKTELARGPAP
jgi:hypothetical protein